MVEEDFRYLAARNKIKVANGTRYRDTIVTTVKTKSDHPPLAASKGNGPSCAENSLALQTPSL
jgi:hypothetical protein